MHIADLANLRVAIWGMGREGRAVHSALRRRLPELALTLYCADADVQLLQTDHRLDRCVTTVPSAGDLCAFEVVIKSPGISAYRPELLEAQRNGTRFTSATALWFAEHPEARVIAVTGTKGKSTTSALIAHLLRGLGKRVALAGNIGMPLLELLDPPIDPDWWVIEVSSFQTREVDHADLAVVTNIEEEHLDWHGNRSRYVEDKLSLSTIARQLLINGTQPELVQRTATHPQRLMFGVPASWTIDAASIRRADRIVFDRSRMPCPGPHNALNAAAALAALEAIGEDAIAGAEHLASFRPLPHRLQTLGVRDGISWIDDSIATTPQAVIEALRSHADRKLRLIIGGHDRGLDWRAFAEHVHAYPPEAIIINGANGSRIEALLRAEQGNYSLHHVETLSEAVSMARQLTDAGGTILLSPGAPSFDQFRDYAERGRRFAELAGFDADVIAQIEGVGIA